MHWASALLLLAATAPPPSSALSPRLLRRRTASAFTHAYDAYMKHAYPLDELTPLSCGGSDAFYGGVSLTLIDALDALVVFGNRSEFARAAALVAAIPNFDRDVSVSVFETNIRAVGALLAGHTLAADESLALLPPGASWIAERLLELAIDLGTRLLPAFDTPTGIPYGSINLRRGVARGETSVTCTSGAGTFLLEFGMLSRLSGDPAFENAARRAMRAIFARRSKRGLLGAHIDARSGAWTQLDSGIGSFIDSTFEYLIKAYVLFGEEEDLVMFLATYRAVLKHLKVGPWYIEANMRSGNWSWPHFSSLQGFWPGMQVLWGDVRMAAESLRAFWTLWTRYGFVPERFDLSQGEIAGPAGNNAAYALRPELIESAMHLYQATRDPFWLMVGRDFLTALLASSKVPCGFATVEDVRDHELRDIMESFFLAETLKYAFLLFDPEHFLHKSDYLYTTEGHLLRPVLTAVDTAIDTNDNATRRQSTPKEANATRTTKAKRLTRAVRRRREVLRNAVKEISAWPRVGATCERVSAQEVLAGVYAVPGRGTCHRDEAAYFPAPAAAGRYFAKATKALTKQGLGNTSAFSAVSALAKSKDLLTMLKGTMKDLLTKMVGSSTRVTGGGGLESLLALGDDEVRVIQPDGRDVEEEDEDEDPLFDPSEL